MKLYHYVVIVPVDDDGTIGKPYLDDAAVLSDVDNPVWDESEEEWEGQDDDVAEKIGERLRGLLP